MKVIRKSIALLLAAAIAFASLSLTAMAANSKKKSSEFIHTSGQYIVDEQNKKYLIKAAGFGNEVWQNPTTPPEFRVDETKYEDLAIMGFNAVRFYLNYQLFESDKAPYKYRDVGFDWIDRNLKMAKKYNIRLILNMHVPQGGYQSCGEGEALWTDKNNQKRLIALWSKIAERYADDPSVIGYGIVNEPTPYAKTVDEGLEKWRSLAQSITDSIRKYDKNHIIFVEKINGVKIKSTGNVVWASEIDPEKFYPTIKDSNYAYEFHTYDPGAYANQGDEGYPERYTYPGQSKLVGNAYWLDSVDSPLASADKLGEWQYVETEPFKIADPKIKIIGITFGASNTGKNGLCYADDLIIYEYDENGKLVNTLPCETNDYQADYMELWSMDGTGNGKRVNDFGRSDKTCICISGTESLANMGMIKVKAVQGHSYKATGYIRIERTAPDPWVNVSLALYDSDWNTFIGLDKDYLIEKTNEFTLQCRKNKIPVYCGEMGVQRGCFEDDRGGERWVSDLLDIFIENNIGFTYHDHLSENFGIYFYPFKYITVDNNYVTRNEELAKVFAEKLGGKYATPKYSLAVKYIPSFTVKKSGNKYTLSWKAVGNITKYQIQYSYDGGKTYKKPITVAKSKTSTTLKLDSKKRCTFRMRTYYTYKGITYYGSWSDPVTV